MNETHYTTLTDGTPVIETREGDGTSAGIFSIDWNGFRICAEDTGIVNFEDQNNYVHRFASPLRGILDSAGLANLVRLATSGVLPELLNLATGVPHAAPVILVQPCIDNDQCSTTPGQLTGVDYRLGESFIFLDPDPTEPPLVYALGREDVPLDEWLAGFAEVQSILNSPALQQALAQRTAPAVEVTPYICNDDLDREWYGRQAGIDYRVGQAEVHISNRADVGPRLFLGENLDEYSPDEGRRFALNILALLDSPDVQQALGPQA